MPEVTSARLLSIVTIFSFHDGARVLVEGSGTTVQLTNIALFKRCQQIIPSAHSFGSFILAELHSEVEQRDPATPIVSLVALGMSLVSERVPHVGLPVDLFGPLLNYSTLLSYAEPLQILISNSELLVDVL